MINFTRGGGGVNMFCRQHGFDLKIVDMGVDYDLSAYPTIIDRKIARGTDNFLYRPAMNESQFHQAIDTGAELVDECRWMGADIICIGEMGIANTSPSSIWMSMWGNIPLQECIGAGSGLNDEGIARKCAILQRVVDNFLAAGNDPDDPETVIRYFAGYEMAGAIGAMLRAAELKMAVMVDGFIMSACMLAASRLYPDVLRYAIFGHCGDEVGHRRMLALMDAQPLLSLNLRLGEGTGALCAFPIIDSAVRMINELNNFQNAQITKYF